MSAPAQKLALARADARSRHADAGVVTEMARSLRREARGTREARGKRESRRARELACARRLIAAPRGLIAEPRRVARLA